MPFSGSTYTLPWVFGSNTAPTANGKSGDVAPNAGTFPLQMGDDFFDIAAALSALSAGTAIVNGAITYAKIQNVTNARLLGNNSGGAAPPEEISVGSGLSLSGTTLSTAAANTPNIQVLTSGSNATYTTPTSGGNLPLYLRVRMVGGGGGGGAGITNPGQAGNDTSFASWTAIHGTGGGQGVTTSTVPAGGTGGSGGTNSTGTVITRMAGNPGQSGCFNGTSGIYGGGLGGASVFGGAGAGSSGSSNQAGGNAATNSGSGGGGAQTTNASGAGGGGSGEFVEFIITTPASTYTYTVGTGGNGGTAGTVAGGNGAAGRIEVIAYWQ